MLVVILLVGPVQDALFGVVLVTNAAVGILQELRAKWTLDRLALVSAADCVVLRGGERRRLPAQDVVLDDVLVLAPGDQLVADAVVVDSAHLEVDESLVSGEAAPVAKRPGDELLGGSFVAAGNGTARTVRVGESSYGRKLAAEARQFKLTRSELRRGIDTVLRLVTWLLVPSAGLLVVRQLASNESMHEALRGSVAGIGSMVPEGLVLLTSVASAVGIVRLGRHGVLVQELDALEGLARVDVLCVDKTGTLTSTDLHLVAVEELGDGGATEAIAALGAADPSPNPTIQAIATALPASAGWVATAVVTFSSARKWSGTTFADQGTWVIGAPDVILANDDPLLDRTRERSETGARVLLVARAADELRGEHLPEGLRPAALVVLEEEIRPDAAATLAWFAEQGVAVKVLSGDHPGTVAAVARRAGLAGGGEIVDARTLPEDADALATVVDSALVFGRVVPHQKRAIIASLQRHGHVVAMTGDGVNDVLALKDADLGIAMGSGTAASRAVAQVVLLDDAFAALPAVMAEGRRVVANVERVANLFLTKTVYAFALAMAVVVARLPFPFLPRHLTIISSLTIGIPAFFLALAPNAARARPGFIGRVLRFALPAGAVAATATFIAYALARQEGSLSKAEARTTATLVLFAVAIQVLVLLARPLTPLRRVLISTMVGAFGLALAVPATRTFFALDLPDRLVVAEALGVAAIAMFVLDAGWALAALIGRHRTPVT